MQYTNTPKDLCFADSMLSDIIVAPPELKDEIDILLQAIQRAEYEPYTYLAAHLKERLRLIQDDPHCAMMSA